jgi:hypothetical protein
MDKRKIMKVYQIEKLVHIDYNEHHADNYILAHDVYKKWEPISPLYRTQSAVKHAMVQIKNNLDWRKSCQGTIITVEVPDEYGMLDEDDPIIELRQYPHDECYRITHIKVLG